MPTGPKGEKRLAEAIGKTRRTIEIAAARGEDGPPVRAGSIH